MERLKQEFQGITESDPFLQTLKTKILKDKSTRRDAHELKKFNTHDSSSIDGYYRVWACSNFSLIRNFVRNSNAREVYLTLDCPLNAQDLKNEIDEIKSRDTITHWLSVLKGLGLVKDETKPFRGAMYQREFSKVTGGKDILMEHLCRWYKEKELLEEAERFKKKLAR
jgi:hypothetical protein